MSGWTGGLRNWTLTPAATAASTYALDACATAAGISLVASGLLGGFNHQWAVAFLVGTYGLWRLGLRANLGAPWTLLATTGISSNVVSKGRARRTAVALEVPYYAGAFGAALLSDSITPLRRSSSSAARTSGRPLYVYGLAYLTRAFLRRRRGYASFDTDWSAAEYLNGYYHTVEPDEIATIAYFVDALRHAERGRPVLFFGVGPTLHHVFAAAELASEIHLGDYLPANLAEIQRWIDREPGAHDWRPFVRYTLQCEGISNPTEHDVAAREDLTRRKITELIRVDGRHPRPVDRRYPTVVSAYCADSATADLATWQRFMRHIAGLVQPGGLFVTAALRRCRGYTIAGKTFPSANIDEHDLRAVLQPEFSPVNGSIDVRQTAQDTTHGYGAIVLSSAHRRSPPNPSRLHPRRPALAAACSPAPTTQADH